MPRALLALAIGAFGIGTTEFVVMGMLPEVAEGLGVSVPSVGLLISAYAVGVVIGAPTLTALGVDDFATHRVPLAEAPEAYANFREKKDGAVKVLLQP